MWPFVNQRKRRGGTSVGVAFAADGVALAAVAPGDRDHAPRLTAWTRLPAGDRALAERMRDWVEEHDLERCRGVGVIAPGDYQVVQIEAPPVPAAEMRQAAAWRVRDLIDFPLAEAVVETFPPPDSAQRGQNNVNVVVARRAAVAGCIEPLREAGLALDAIDIPELAQHNLAARLPEARGGHALLALDEAGGLITVYRDGEQFLARGLDTGLGMLARDFESGAETLVLEVQRSFDYFESALSQPPLGALYLFPAADPVDALVDRFADNLSNVEVRAFGPGDLLTVDEPPERAGAALLQAIGAALRSPGGRS